MTKQELINHCEAHNIFYRKSWKKSQIQANIDNNVTNDSKVTVKCNRSGIEFEVLVSEAKASQNHPQVSELLQSTDRDDYGAIASIVECGWESIEELKQAVKDYYTEEEAQGYELVLKTGQSRRAWVALLTGADKTYGFARQFVEHFKEEGRSWYFDLEDGIYQAKEYSAKGNEHVYFFQIKEQSLTYLEESEVKKIVGYCKPEKKQASSAEVAEEPTETVDFDIKLEDQQYAATVGSVTDVDGKTYRIVKVEVVKYVETHDGIVLPSFEVWDWSEVQFEFSRITWFLKKETEEERVKREKSTAKKEQEKHAEEQKKDAVLREKLTKKEALISQLKCTGGSVNASELQDLNWEPVYLNLDEGRFLGTFDNSIERSEHPQFGVVYREVFGNVTSYHGSEEFVEKVWQDTADKSYWVEGLFSGTQPEPITGKDSYEWLCQYGPAPLWRKPTGSELSDRGCVGQEFHVWNALKNGFTPPNIVG